MKLKLNRNLAILAVLFSTVTLHAERRRSGGLIPANTRRNPAFSYLVHNRGGAEGCQATLISSSGGRCIAATASHCLTSGIGRSQRQLRRGGFWRNAFDNNSSCPAATARRGAIWGEAQVEMADFGRVNATLFVNPEYVGGRRSEDSAIFIFNCPNGPGNVPVIPLSDTPLRSGEAVAYGKVMGGREGLYNGVIMRERGVVGINGRRMGEAQESVVQPQGVVIQQGDSGGPLLQRVGNSWRLAGLLSTSDDVRRRRPIGNYATNRSLDFVRCLMRRYGGRDDVAAAAPPRTQIGFSQGQGVASGNSHF